MSRISDLVREGFKETRETGEALKEAGKNLHAINLGRLGGLSTSEAKKQASRLNGKKGGRPVTKKI